jgi:hypothetical protein
MLCTMDYLPVCGLRRSEGRDAAMMTEWKTYSNACTACSDTSVIGYVQDACPPPD